jgi:Rab family protein
MRDDEAAIDYNGSTVLEITGKMAQMCRKVIRIKIRWTLLERLSIFHNFFRVVWNKLLACSMGRRFRYRRLSRRPSSPSEEALELESAAGHQDDSGPDTDSDSDLVSLKISVLGDCQIGKTSFVMKYVGDEQENKSLEMRGLNLTDKTLVVKGARIAFRIWDVGGDQSSLSHVPIACKDAVAILFMFDLTSRCTLNSVVEWYNQARKWNQTAIPILIGTKFDDFVLLPPDLQWTIVTQARAYAKGMKGTVFFSSAKHNINVNKIFKFIISKLFNLPWTLPRNLTPGEPIIDF